MTLRHGTRPDALGSKEFRPRALVILECRDRVPIGRSVRAAQPREEGSSGELSHPAWSRPFAHGLTTMCYQAGTGAKVPGGVLAVVSAARFRGQFEGQKACLAGLSQAERS